MRVLRTTFKVLRRKRPESLDDVERLGWASNRVMSYVIVTLLDKVDLSLKLVRFAFKVYD